MRRTSDNAVKAPRIPGVSDEAQELYARANFEYPVKPGAKVDPIIAAFGTLNPDSVPLTEVGETPRARQPTWSTRWASTTDRRVTFCEGFDSGRAGSAASTDWNGIAWSTCVRPAPR